MATVGYLHKPLSLLFFFASFYLLLLAFSYRKCRKTNRTTTPSSGVRFPPKCSFHRLLRLCLCVILLTTPYPSLPVRTQYFSEQRRRLSMSDRKIWPVGIISWTVSCIAGIEMATKAKSKGIINDTTPLICTIEGIAKKVHVVSPLQWWQLT